ncbi:unnamed protein product [Cylicocyclus nassatus]|uniref:Uncharacterized protein n=1 Tax=Cylicocyclus nassatus TaxID=53992 RepID=A0AA36ME54_CYLNA|nr:unnamed protein product [Cylicocyclus nassatus]
MSTTATHRGRQRATQPAPAKAAVEKRVEEIPGWLEKKSDVAKHLIMKYTRKADQDSAEQSKLTGSEMEFINATTIAMSPNMKTPPYDSLKLQNVENELGAPRSVVATRSGINWFLIHCVLCPKLLCTMYYRFTRNGGAYFLIPLSLTSVLLAAPLSFMELALGQYTSKQAIILFPRMIPILSGIGYAMLAMRMVLILGLRTEHRLCSLIWEIIGSTFFERRNVECLAQSSDCYVPNVCRTPNIFYNGACYDLRSMRKDDSLTTEGTILLNTRELLYRDIYSDEYNLPIAADSRVLGRFPGCHRIDGVMLFFTICFLCSALGISRFSKISSFVVICSIFALFVGFASFFLSGYGLIIDKFFFMLNNDMSKLLSFDTWLEAIYVSFLLLSTADGSLHSLGSFSSFSNDIVMNIVHSCIFNVIFVIICSILFGITSCIGLEFKYRQGRRIDAPNRAIRNMFEKYIENQDFATPLYYFASSSAYTKAASAVLVIALTLLSTAEHVLLAEDVLMMLFHFCPSLLRLNTAIARHCILSILFIVLSIVYYNLTYTVAIEKSYIPLFMSVSILVVWECVCVGWCYTSYRLLVNIRTMGTSSSPVIDYGQHMNVYLHFSWRYIIPVIVSVTAILGLTHQTILAEFSWTSLTTIFICVLPLIYAVKEVAAGRRKKAVMASLFRSTDRWGPLSIQHRRMAEFDEKAARITV